MGMAEKQIILIILKFQVHSRHFRKGLLRAFPLQITRDTRTSPARYAHFWLVTSLELNDECAQLNGCTPEPVNDSTKEKILWGETASYNTIYPYVVFF